MAQKLKVTEDAKRVLNCIRQLVRELRLSDRETQGQFGLSAAQVFVLHAVREQDGLTVNDIAERTATDQSSASVVIQRLVDRGLVERNVNPQDRRSVLLTLTKRGRKVMLKSPSTAQEKIFASLSRMSARERHELLSLFQEFLRGMGVGSRDRAPMLFEDEPPPRRRSTSGRRSRAALRNSRR